MVIAMLTCFVPSFFPFSLLKDFYIVSTFDPASHYPLAKTIRRSKPLSPIMQPTSSSYGTLNMNINDQLRTPTLPFTRTNKTTATTATRTNTGLPFARRFPDHVRNHFVAVCGEFIGTVLFLFFALSGAQVANNIPSTDVAGTTQPAKVVGSNPSQLQYIALSFGFSLVANAWVFFRISGGLFNPSVSIPSLFNILGNSSIRSPTSLILTLLL